MAEPADSALVTATGLLNDNRTVVYGRTATNQRVVVLPTLPNGMLFVAKTPAGVDIAETEVAADASKAAHVGTANPVGTVTVPLDVTTPISGTVLTSKHARKQLFRSLNLATGAVTEKWCYTDIKGMPLTAAGVVTTVALAADATTTTLTAGAATSPTPAVTNYVQSGPAPGTYTVSDLQQGTSRFIGWTAQKG